MGTICGLDATPSGETMARYLITGANRGIGLALTSLMVKQGHQVVAVCRTSSPELDALGVEVRSGLDVTSDDQVQSLAQSLRESHFDGLILNAGILTRETLFDLNLDRIRKQFEVNAVAPLHLTSALLPTLSSGSKIILITSRMGSIDDNTSGGMYGYRMSKVALNMAGRSLTHDLRGKGIAVGIIHPGHVQTGMTSHTGNISAEDCALQIWGQIERLSMENTGTFWHANGQVLPW